VTSISVINNPKQTATNVHHLCGFDRSETCGGFFAIIQFSFQYLIFMLTADAHIKGAIMSDKIRLFNMFAFSAGTV